MSTSTAIYETGVSASYLQHWDTISVLKEFIQNAVFAKDILGDSADFDYVDGFAIIKNHPSGFTRNDLLIGESQQRKHANSPGFYGEGQKMAMLVAAREGLECTIQTNGFNVLPILEGSSLDPNTKVLKFNIEDTEVHEGTIVKVQCSEADFYTAMEEFLSLSGQEYKTDKSSVLTNSHLSGDLYVNGVRVQNGGYYFAYNLTDRSIMNRDRNTVNTAEANHAIGELLFDLPMDKCVELLKAIPEQYLERNTQPITPNSKATLADYEKWGKALKKVYGNKVGLAEGSSADVQAEYKNYTLLTQKELPNSWYNFFRFTVPGINCSSDILAMEPMKRVHRKPTKDESSNLGWAKRLIKLYYADYGTVKIAENLVDAHGNQCFGIYDSSTDTIWLDRFILSSKKATFTTLLHETIHKVTGAQDNTAMFTKAWEDASYSILMRGKVNE